MFDRWQKMLLAGLQLIIFGLVLPWHHISWEYTVPLAVGGAGTVSTGLNQVSGWLMLVFALAMFVLALLPWQGGARQRAQVAQGFLLGLIALFWFATGLIPALSYAYLSPRLGLAVVLAGCIAAGVGLFNDLREIWQKKQD